MPYSLPPNVRIALGSVAGFAVGIVLAGATMSAGFTEDFWSKLIDHLIQAVVNISLGLITVSPVLFGIWKRQESIAKVQSVNAHLLAMTANTVETIATDAGEAKIAAKTAAEIVERAAIKTAEKVVTANQEALIAQTKELKAAIQNGH